MDSDEIRDRQMILELEDPNGEPVRLLGSPLKFSESSVAQNVKLPPRLAEHTREVLAELAGVDEARLQQLIKRGVTSVE
jgi:crotonobetainyl-CoA:carnitine CoA-transferase CaiB-like acyl-CoA transferase